MAEEREWIVKGLTTGEKNTLLRLLNDVMYHEAIFVGEPSRGAAREAERLGVDLKVNPLKAAGYDTTFIDNIKGAREKIFNAREENNETKGDMGS